MRQVAKWGVMVWVALLSPSGLWAQGTRIDTILITVDDPFTQKQAAGSFFFRTMNSLHVTTHEPVIRRQLLLSVGGLVRAPLVPALWLLCLNLRCCLLLLYPLLGYGQSL